MIKYFCNVCGKEVQTKDMTVVLVKKGTEENKRTLHLCEECNAALIKAYMKLSDTGNERDKETEENTEAAVDRKVVSIEDKRLSYVSAETVAIEQWVTNDKIESFMDGFPKANCLSEVEFACVCPFIRGFAKPKRYIVNLLINGYDANSISKVLGIKYSQVYPFIGRIIKDAKNKSLTEEERVNVMNLLRVKWFICDIAADQHIDIDKVVAVHLSTLS